MIIFCSFRNGFYVPLIIQFSKFNNHFLFCCKYLYKYSYNQVYLNILVTVYVDLLSETDINF